jgi:hypothetical protein
MSLEFRALELHGGRMWERSRVVDVLAFMNRNAMNTLVLHESDLVHQVVYPRAYFDPYALWSDLPSRRGENAIFNNRAYFGHLLKLASDAGIQVWVNVKEIGFSDEVLSIHPEVFKDGVICPSEPFWSEYVEHKADELFSDFPLLSGMIVSLGSQESRASRVQNSCKCELCRSESLEQWYSRFISVLHRPVSRHGKQLAIRDFAYKPEDHTPLVRAMDAAPSDVIFCIKAMPHDFYITFPDNPAIGLLRRRQWVEYDVMGQFFGWGLMPCFVLEDLRARLKHWQSCNVEGGIFRIEWERINDLDCLDTLNETNLIAAAALARGIRVETADVCLHWLASKGWAEHNARWLADILDRTLPVVRHAAYINDAVSADNSMLPRSIQRAWWGMETRDSLAVWDTRRATDLDLDRAKVDAYVREKDDALAAAKALVERVRQSSAEVQAELKAYVERQFIYFDTWVEGLGLGAKICVYQRWLARTPDPIRTDIETMAGFLEQLARYAAKIQALSEDSSVPHQVVMLLDYRRALDILREGREALEQARASGSAPI